MLWFSHRNMYTCYTKSFPSKNAPSEGVPSGTCVRATFSRVEYATFQAHSMGLQFPCWELWYKVVQGGWCYTPKASEHVRDKGSSLIFTSLWTSGLHRLTHISMVHQASDMHNALWIIQTAQVSVSREQDTGRKYMPLSVASDWELFLIFFIYQWSYTLHLRSYRSAPENGPHSLGCCCQGALVMDADLWSQGRCDGNSISGPFCF